MNRFIIKFFYLAENINQKKSIPLAAEKPWNISQVW